ncbi:MAG: hypothetical protein IJO94_08150 [Firmicutes bacterium]|nr:hypothetical protein [Bacillota bacterium]
MKHKILVLCSVLALLCLIFCACGEKRTTDAYHVTRTVGLSELFSEEEIIAAMDAMILAFPAYAEDYLNCTLTEVIYDEEISVTLLAEGSTFLANVRNVPPKAMVLTTVHSIEETASEPNLIPAQEGLTHHWLATYENGKWIITEPNTTSTIGIGLRKY